MTEKCNILTRLRVRRTVNARERGSTTDNHIICTTDTEITYKAAMDEAEKYQQRLQAITENRRMQEEEDKVRRVMEEERLKLEQHKRKFLREQWLTEVTPSRDEDPTLQSVIPTPQTTEQSAEETQISEKQMNKEVERMEIMNEDSSQIGENEPTIHSEGVIKKPAQAHLVDEETNVLEVLEDEVERNLLSKAAQERTEEKKMAKSEEQEADPLTMDVAQPVDHLLQQSKAPDEATLFTANDDDDDDAEVEEEEWEMVSCSPEEGLDQVLASDSTQAHTDSGVGHDGEGAALKMEQVDEEEDLESGASELLCLVQAEKRSDLQEPSCESKSECNAEERPPEGTLQTICLEKGGNVGTSAPLREPGIISKEPPAYSAECKQNVPHLTAHTTQVIEEGLRDNIENMGDQSVWASTVVKVEWNEALGPDNEEIRYIPLDRKRENSPSLLQTEIVASNTEQGSEMQIQLPSTVTPNRAETVTSIKTKTCHCCTVM